MKKLLLFLLFCICYANAQQSHNATSGNGIGTGGNRSFTVGQIDYVAVTGSTGSISQGGF